MLVTLVGTLLNDTVDKDSVAFSYGSCQKFVSHRQEMRGGGVMCLVNNVYRTCKLLKLQNFPESSDCLVIMLNSISAVLLVVNRPGPPTCLDAVT